MEKKIKGFPGKDWRNDLAKKVLKHISPPKSVKEKNNYFVSGSTIISIPKKNKMKKISDLKLFDCLELLKILYGNFNEFRKEIIVEDTWLFIVKPEDRYGLSLIVSEPRRGFRSMVGSMSLDKDDLKKLVLINTEEDNFRIGFDIIPRLEGVYISIKQSAFDDKEFILELKKLIGQKPSEEESKKNTKPWIENLLKTNTVIQKYTI